MDQQNQLSQQQNSGDNPSANQYQEDILIDQELYKQQLEFIKKEAEGDSPLIGDLQTLDALEKEFENNMAFLQKIFILKDTYPQVRRVRRDGSCFYRSYLFQIFEHIVSFKDTELQSKIIEIIKQSKEDLKKVGYEEMVLDDFYEPMIEKLELLTKPEFSHNELMSIFIEKYISDSLVMYLRFMTSGYLKMNAVLFENYIDNGMTIEKFCACEVDPIDKEADQIPIMALISYLNVPIKIIYLDSNINKINPDVIILPEGTEESKVFVTLLYRPGHYDIVYKK
ncbi:hypothetical protein ABPG72_006156 [Tetrahymena utriculariae]